MHTQVFWLLWVRTYIEVIKHFCLKVNKLQLELENTNILYKETVDSYNNEIELAKATEEKLLKEVKVYYLVVK